MPHGVLAERLAEAYRVIAQLTAQVREMAARVEEAVAENGRLAARVGALERRAGKDSSTSSKPPSSDSPYKKKPRGRSLREKGERAPGKQPGEPGTTMRLVDGPAHRFWYPPAECGGAARTCPGRRSSRSAATRSPTLSPRRRRRSPSTWRSRRCARARHSARENCQRACGRGRLRAGSARSGGPCDLRGLYPRGPGGEADGAAGRAAGLRRVDRRGASEGRRPGRFERLHGPGGGAAAAGGGGPRGRDPGPRRRRPALRPPGLHPVADAHAHPGPVRARRRCRGVLPGYTGIIVRDGYHGGYGHLTGALHAGCGAHLLRDLRDLYQFEPGKQDWAKQMACLSIETRVAALRLPRRRGKGPGTRPPPAA